MNDFWKKHKIKIIILIYIIAASLLTRFLMLPFVDKIRGESDSIQEKIIDNKISESRISKLPEMEETFKNYQDNSGALRVILNPDDEVNFIKQLESIADDTGNRIVLSIEDNKAEQTAKKTTTDKSDEKKTIKDSLKYDNYISMNINLKGNYSGLVNFIHKLENTSYYVNVISIKTGKILESLSSDPNSASSVDMFSIPVSSQDEGSGIQLIEDKKEMLDSIIKVVIYTEK